MFDLDKLLTAVDNPIMKGVLAAGGTAAIIAATTAFAPIGVVGAAGWTLVYWVFGGTITLDTAKRLWDVYTKMSSEKRKKFDDEMDKLKRLFDEGAITKEEFNAKAKSMYEKFAE
ncbi:SHOCT domain-containing protein [Parashewanella spongiae]|uniref:SHOCT domain-containing protein n=1 Tax=Parashewanella spongiae TaxID=342950 RepID=A0A3A6TNE1_9GAMM|nr:SHOCT domain-containing protein [Parashewanella spongiae]MCL1078708.1 SHOCT domain-containing protein [Parashewanella spongiae]RJY12279.1 SHOCT domain-containing protein [Parashewanella spongiae]